uniref:NADH-ubiquinone oxidoreductase chain 4L n=1 Tax=Oncopodura yosiiana TaxID=2581075 RepID=A0A6H0EVS3_9HEXA|nr:NADH dehydrogenase subunit 4L [Oncopodura yosiiana]QIT06428.1 NADH dehydrogenase subunit 4L [Oncopodura yosiiana]
MIVLVGLLGFSFWRKHLLSVLLSLEYIALGIYFLFFLSLWSFHDFYSLFYLIFIACEGALGLSIMVNMSRSYGGDYMSLFIN